MSNFGLAGISRCSVAQSRSSFYYKGKPITTPESNTSISPISRIARISLLGSSLLERSVKLIFSDR